MARRSRRLTVLFRGIFTVFRFVAGLLPRDRACHYTLIWRLILCISGPAAQGDWTMDEQRFNMSMRKFLKEVGVTSQQGIERVVRDESLGGKGKLKVKMVLTAEGSGLKH